MDGLLVIDKPAGPTSHDVVARVRRVLREKRIGHTGTLDPMASGVLPLVVGRATRLARFMAADEKRYLAEVRFGFATDTGDAMGTAIGTQWTGHLPATSEIEGALDRFRGTFLQQPPAFSAKKVDGQRSYQLARRRRTEAADSAPTAAAAPLPSPAEVTAYRIDLLGGEDDRVTLDVSCSSGFYVRSLAHDLGEALGIGGHLTSLRRTATSGVTLADAVPLEALEQGIIAASDRLVAFNALLPNVPAVVLTGASVDRVRQGRDVGPSDCLSGFPFGQSVTGPFRLMTPSGDLLAIGEPATVPGFLHPAVVLV